MPNEVTRFPAEARRSSGIPGTPSFRHIQAGWALGGAFSGVVGVHFRFYFKMKRRQTGA